METRELCSSTPSSTLTNTKMSKLGTHRGKKNNSSLNQPNELLGVEIEKCIWLVVLVVLQTISEKDIPPLSRVVWPPPRMLRGGVDEIPEGYQGGVCTHLVIQHSVPMSPMLGTLATQLHHMGQITPTGLIHLFPPRTLTN